MKYLHQNGINAYIPDNQFRSRDPKFKDQTPKSSAESSINTGLQKPKPEKARNTELTKGCRQKPAIKNEQQRTRCW